MEIVMGSPTSCLGHQHTVSLKTRHVVQANIFLYQDFFAFPKQDILLPFFCPERLAKIWNLVGCLGEEEKLMQWEISYEILLRMYKVPVP